MDVFFDIRGDGIIAVLTLNPTFGPLPFPVPLRFCEIMRIRSLLIREADLDSRITPALFIRVIHLEFHHNVNNPTRIIVVPKFDDRQMRLLQGQTPSTPFLTAP